MTTPSSAPGWRPDPAQDPLSERDRAARLDSAVLQEVDNGGRVESHTLTHAVIVYGAGNILLHITFAVLTLFTCGLFVFPWIAWANTNREHRVTIEVDPYGNIIRSGQYRRDLSARRTKPASDV